MAKQPRAQQDAKVQWHPYAECISADSDGNPCGWEHPVSGLTRDRAKDHATFRNHKVRIVQETVAVWSRPDYNNANDLPDEDAS